MPIVGLKRNLNLMISVEHNSFSEFEESWEESSLDRSDTFGSTTSEDLRVNTIFNAVADGTLAVPTPPISDDQKKQAQLVIGQRVLCRDDSKDSWKDAVVRSVHPVRVSAEGGNIKRSFKNIKPFCSILKRGNGLNGSLPTPEGIKQQKVTRTVSVGGSLLLNSPRNVKFTLVEFANSESVENLAITPPLEPLSPDVTRTLVEQFNNVEADKRLLIEELKNDDTFFDELFE